MAYIPLSLPPGIEKRFMAKVIISLESGCWEWNATKTLNGYGRIGINRKTMLAHRLSYLMYKGDIPNDLHICHSCDNRKCVNPDHLWAGTRQENMDDCVRKGRARGPNYKGSMVGTSKLSEEQVREIKVSLSDGASCASLGRKYSVTPQAISRIKFGHNWSHLRPE